MAALTPLSSARRIVIKIGSALLVDPETGMLRSTWLEALASDIAERHSNKTDIILVSSGAIALGRTRLGLSGKALSLAQKQACAATGQSLLTQAYEGVLSTHGIITAQALLTLHDTEDRRRWLNARSTLEALLDLGAVPIINENDTVATDEIRYGDNDRLAARTAQMVGADVLILLSDIDGLYTSDPRADAEARHLPTIETLTPDIMAMGGEANSAAAVGTGGMVTKLAAAKIAVNAGTAMCIANGTEPAPLSRLKAGERCTWFTPVADPKDARRQWISGHLKPKGCLVIDQGAEKALRSGKSLLAAGVIRVEGEFEKGDAVRILSAKGEELARGLIAYDCKDVTTLKGHHSTEIADLLGYDNGAALVHRDNMVITDR